MAERRPLVVKNGVIQEIPSGDTINTTIAPGSGGSVTGEDIETALDTYYGNTDWRTQKNVAYDSDITSSASVTDSDLAGFKVKSVISTSAITITIPSGLTGTEAVTFIQEGLEDVTFAAGVGVNIHSLDNKLKIVGMYGSVSLIPKGSDTYILIGGLKA